MWNDFALIFFENIDKITMGNKILRFQFKTLQFTKEISFFLLVSLYIEFEVTVLSLISFDGLQNRQKFN